MERLDETTIKAFEKVGELAAENDQLKEALKYFIAYSSKTYWQCAVI